MLSKSPALKLVDLDILVDGLHHHHDHHRAWFASSSLCMACIDERLSRPEALDVRGTMMHHIRLSDPSMPLIFRRNPSLRLADSSMLLTSFSDLERARLATSASSNPFSPGRNQSNSSPRVQSARYPGPADANMHPFYSQQPPVQSRFQSAGPFGGVPPMNHAGGTPYEAEAYRTNQIVPYYRPQPSYDIHSPLGGPGPYVMEPVGGPYFARPAGPYGTPRTAPMAQGGMQGSMMVQNDHGLVEC